jgi:hypothetical protein
VDPIEATWHKLAVNRSRTWKIDPETGIMSHVPRS